MAHDVATVDVADHEPDTAQITVLWDKGSVSGHDHANCDQSCFSRDDVFAHLMFLSTCLFDCEFVHFTMPEAH